MNAELFARQIVTDWNSMVLEEFLQYFTEDVEIISNNIKAFISESNGRLQGKKTLKLYWEYTREKFPYFKYKLFDVNFEDYKLILRFMNDTDQVTSMGILYFNQEMKIYKMTVSYV